MTLIIITSTNNLNTLTKWRSHMTRQILNKTTFLPYRRETTRYGKRGTITKNNGYVQRIYEGRGTVPRLRGMFATLQDADNIRSRD